MYTTCTKTVADHIIGSPAQLEEKLKIAQEGEKEAKRQHAAGEHVLTRVRGEKNKLQDSNTTLGEELKDVRAQLADPIKENKKLRGGLFSMWRKYSHSVLNPGSPVKCPVSFPYFPEGRRTGAYPSFQSPAALRAKALSSDPGMKMISADSN